MKDKLYYHKFFNENRKYLNIAALCREVNCNKVQMTIFLKDQYHLDSMNTDKLKAMYEIVQNIANY